MTGCELRKWPKKHTKVWLSKQGINLFYFYEQKSKSLEKGKCVCEIHVL